MPPKVTKRWVPVNRPGEASSSRGHSGGAGGGGIGGDGGVDLAADRLSALPDALLHHVMSFMKAWDVSRTCVLSRRWRNLWASAPCVDIRVGRYSDAPENYDKFVYRLLLSREPLAPVETLRLRSPGEDDHDFDMDDVRMWISHAIRRNARVIQLSGHLHVCMEIDGADFVSCNLRVLKFSYAELDDKALRLICSRCTSLEELELKHCEVGGREVVSASLKSLAMVKCKFTRNLSVDAPRLVSLQCILPENWVPLFKNFGALISGIVKLDDSLLSREFEKYKEEDEFPLTSDEDDDNNSTHAEHTGRNAPASDDSDDDFDFMTDDWGDFNDHYCHPIKDNYDYGSDINSDTDTYEYSEIAKGIEVGQFENLGDGPDCSKGSKYRGSSAKYVINDYKKLGGQNVIHSLSNAQSLELLGHSGEVLSLTLLLTYFYSIYTLLVYMLDVQNAAPAYVKKYITYRI
jgi:hypothetical protein